MRRDGTLNDYATFAFTGTAVTYYATEDTNRGDAAVSLDGGAETLVDLYAATQRGNVAVYTRTGLSTGTHTLKVRVSGQKDAASSNIVAAIDRVDVRTGTGAMVGSDFSLRATSGGLDARVVVHSPSETGPFTLTLAPDPRTQLVQDPSGAITVTQAVSSYGDDGVADVVTQTEYMIQSALAMAASSDPVAPVDVGAVAMRLGTSGSGAPTLALTVDPAWLSRHTTAYPLAVDLPILTEDAYGQTGVFGTVNSCAPTTPAPPTEMVVGVEGACTYNGQAYFDLSALPNPASIVSATLRLYTPGQTSATSVQVFPNAPPSDPYSAQQAPSWNTAPAVVSGSVGLAQNASVSGWQSWDVTSIVQGWVNDQTTNGGLTLKGSGAPVRFASSLGTGADAPALTPYLDITYGPQSGSSGPVQAMATTAATTSGGPYKDNAGFIYGVNGNMDVCALPNPICHPSYAFNMDVARRDQANQNPAPYGPGVQFIRINVNDPTGLACATTDQGFAYFQSTYRLMAAAYQRKLIPDLVLDRGAPCPNGKGLTDDEWYYNAQYFVQHMSDTNSPLHAYSSLPPTYFEVGNEPNHFQSRYDGFQNYAERFYNAATGLYQALNTTYNGQKKAPPYYRILTGGVTSPDDEGPGCKHGTIDQIYRAIQNAATGAGSHGAVPVGNLGVGVHPYDFATSSFAANYYASGGKPAGGSTRNICGNLGAMNRVWLGRFGGKSFPGGLPLAYTEINYSSSGNSQQLQGTYLTDLFTYLYDTRSQQSATPSTPYIVPGYDRLRVWWHSIANFSNSPTGLYNSDGSEKIFTVIKCTRNSAIHGGGTSVGGYSYTQDYVYYWLRNGHCY